MGISWICEGTVILSNFSTVLALQPSGRAQINCNMINRLPKIWTPLQQRGEEISGASEVPDASRGGGETEREGKEKGRTQTFSGWLEFWSSNSDCFPSALLLLSPSFFLSWWMREKGVKRKPGHFFIILPNTHTWRKLVTTKRLQLNA